ncbi:Na+/H+ antiporter NhaA [Neolewinella antarctica]|uniref:Na(+)/H(+) antiporter NhaA n=1 Tax=Neolewinella antarctica TaxID=442734 RepID=A0ABX0XEA6_9BACT|nr:Na+/H+ antiporter NhaA [Neolewinella antarctica]NJC27425.1 NhaA family Na+:H+ antiporter [Neolewinella antarctica]
MIRSYLLTPFQKFVKLESLSGILLFSATIVAMLWANSPYGDTYQALWETKVTVGAEGFGLEKALILWINDGLMAIFFFLIGLEIKRELMVGELNTVRKATFPIFAAIGGILVPFGLFWLLNDRDATSAGWGIPMATAIAFSLAILKVLGKSVPLGLKIFLTAFAIVDDLGAVLVIAVFYSGGIAWSLLLYSFALLAILYVLAYRGIYFKYLNVIFGVIIWTLFLKSGIHPTIAGVLLAFAVPIRQKIDTSTFAGELTAITDKLKEITPASHEILTGAQLNTVARLEDLVDDFHSPLQHLEHKLHGWVAYFIMPIFALANAGIVFGTDMQLDTALILNIAIALFVGKLLGISLFSFLAVKLGLAELPDGVNAWQIVGVAILAGVGFTMSIFIANLAFPGMLVLIDSAKIGILAGSLVSGIVGAVILKISGKRSAATV